jgi:hypothetical protein
VVKLKKALEENGAIVLVTREALNWLSLFYWELFVCLKVTIL